MKSIFLVLVVCSMIACGTQPSEGSRSTDDKEDNTTVNSVEKLAEGFMFTEGPAVDSEGNVYFTDVRDHKIYVWTLNDELDTFRVESGRANGLYFDKNQNLLACEGDRGRITSTSPEGDYSVFADGFDGKPFNQPNDIWPDEKGGAYFTDPKYGADDQNLAQDGMHVYYIKPGGSGVIRVCDDYVKPNGLIGTPDGQTLYITDAGADKTYRYTIKEDGSLTDKTLFVEYGSDGMSIDTTGNIYITPRGRSSVYIYSPESTFIDSISVPERPTNVCFGGADRNQLYITARTSIYRVKLPTKGVD